MKMHSTVYLLTEYVITVVVVGFIPAGSALRLVGLVLVSICMLQCIPFCMLHMGRTPWAALVGGYSVTYVYHYLDVALLSRWNFEERAPISGLVKPPTENQGARNHLDTNRDTVFQRVLFGLKITSSFRFIGTPYEVKNCPQNTATTRHRFIRRTFTVVLISYTVLDFINSNNDPAIASKYLTMDKIPLFTRLNKVSLKEIFIRTFTVLAAGMSLNCVQGGIYHIFALFAVSLRISEPDEWPPFYGSPRDAFTLVRFWNIFWHQMNTRKFSSIAHYVVHGILRLPRGGFHSRYLRIFIAFMSSGIMHLIDDLAAGISLHHSGALQFFTAQAFGMIVEDIFIRICRSSSALAKLPSFLKKGIGFTWVLLFLIWSVPAYLYPMMWRSSLGLNDSAIPFSFFDSYGERLAAFGCVIAMGIVSLVGISMDG